MAWEWYEHLIYPEWYMHNRAHDAVSQQASKTSSLEHRVDRLEQKIEKLEHHILGWKHCWPLTVSFLPPLNKSRR